MTKTATTSKRSPAMKSAKSARRKKTSASSSVDSEFEAPESPSEAELDSDHLDDDAEGRRPTVRKRKRASSSGKAATKSPKKRKPTNADNDEASDDEELELPNGQKIVGRVVEAPKTGHVAPGLVSQNTLNFLANMKKPECNDRQWFRLHEPVYRVAEKEFKDFVEALTNDFIRVDPQIPHLPPKDVIHRIYRDIRFSNDKTPYKTAFSASFSRSGRKGNFAGYHVAIEPGRTLIAAGLWCPEKNALATIRHHLTRNAQQFRDLISTPDFVNLFGEAKPHSKGERQNVFGSEDELKTAPKGFKKDDENIDLLRLRSFAVFHRFLDSEVLDANFRETLARVVGVARPFVHKLNDMVTLPPDDEDDEDDEDEE